MSTYAVGDVLQLRTGGIAITAGDLDPKRGRRCVWSTKDGVKEKFFSDEMLRPYEEDRVSSIQVKIIDSYEPRFKAALESIARGANNAQEIAAAILKEAEDDPGKCLRT